MAKRKSIRPKKFLVGFLVAIGVFVALTLFFFLYQGSTKPILSVADKFQPGASWKLVSESVEPPRLFCLDVRCPSVHRAWNTGDLVTRSELQRVIDENDLRLTFDGDCEKRPNESGSISLCNASGTVDGMKMTLSVYTNDYEEEDNKVILSVQ